ncbi:SPFH domain-containing protein [Streptomyces sp. NPDC059352]|uniref:SPFH domain-containing protein n=1 Tax=Streptomyces sp. NPDC059352 TaxID=3346810 RepID=UPI00367B833E
MTASTPNPADSGAAASRDAARTARRLTDGTLPRTSPPPGPPATAGDPPPAAAPPAPAVTPPAPAAAPPVPAPAVTPPAPPAATPAPPSVASEGRAAATPTAPATTAPPPAATPDNRGAAEPTAVVAAEDRGAAEPTAVLAPESRGAAGPTAVLAPENPVATQPTPVNQAAARESRPAAPAPTGTPQEQPAPAAPAAPVAGTRTGPPAPSGPVDGTRTGPPAPSSAVAGTPTGRPAPAWTAPSALSAPTAPPEGGSAPASPATGSSGMEAWRAAPPATEGVKAEARTAPAGESPAAPVPAAPAKASGAEQPPAAPASPPADDRPEPVPPAVGKVSVVKERVEAPDFGRITGARVAALAVPVAGVVRVARRKNVIGSETTGSIPVHLLFREEPEGATRAPATDDDEGPDTVAMAVPAVPAKNGKAAIPAPAKTQTQAQAQVKNRPRSKDRHDAKPHSKPHSKAQSTSPSQPTSPSNSQYPSTPRPRADGARPAPTADPDLVERPGAVLPGWVGVAAGALALAGCAAVVWSAGAVPAEAARMLRLPARPYHGIHLGQWALLALGVVATLFALGGLGRGRVGYAWVLTLFGDYRGTVRRTGLVWVSPLLLRRRVDVRLRHWRSEPLPAVDAKGTALDVVVLVVWRVRDTVRAALGVDGHEEYLREQVEAAMARVLSQLPADAFHEDAPTLRDSEAVGEALTRMLSAECAPVGVDVFSAQPTRIEYAPEVAAAMQRRRIAAIDAKHRDSVLTSVVDAVDDVVHRLTSRGLVELDDYERKTLVKDLTVAFYTGRTAPVEGA